MRRYARTINIGGVLIGGENQVTVQSMTNTKTHDIKSTVEQIKKLEEAGCDIVRLAIPDASAAQALPAIKKEVGIPLIADIHFDYRLALMAMENGVDALRINPGNIGSEDKVRKVVDKAKECKIPIRIGVNAGSLPKDILVKYQKPCAEAMVEAAFRHIEILEQMDFRDIKISLKAHDVPLTIAAYKLMAEKSEYPLHLGITEAGTINSGVIKSAVGIGSLLAMGIGDTLRVSLTGDPVQEVKVGREILKSLNLRPYGPTIVSCPTCGRTDIELEKLALQVEEKLAGIKDTITVAVMGCVVNGPGEAREADVGIAGGKGEGLVFKKGEILRRVPENILLDELVKEINEILDERAKD